MKFPRIVRRRRAAKFVRKLIKCQNEEKALTYLKGFLNNCSGWKPDSKRKIYRYICIILLECHRLQVKDNSVVSDILRLAGPDRADRYCAFFLMCWIIEDCLREEEYLFSRWNGYGHIEYFLRHAKESRLMVNGERFINSCHGGLICHFSFLDVAIAGRNLQDLIALLQHGARFPKKTCCHGSQILSTSENYGMAHLLGYILHEARSQNLIDTQLSRLKVESSALPLKFSASCTAFRILARFADNPFSVTCSLAGTATSHGTLPQVDELKSYFDCLFPGSRFGRNEPVSLQHICKCTIRRKLNQNWQLPDGIYKLELPSYLHDYLNLLTD